jgi:hypothetical protein
VCRLGSGESWIADLLAIGCGADSH